MHGRGRNRGLGADALLFQHHSEDEDGVWIDLVRTGELWLLSVPVAHYAPYRLEKTEIGVLLVGL